MRRVVTLVRLVCPRCGFTPGEFLSGAVIGCSGGNPAGVTRTPKHPTARLAPAFPLPLDDTHKEKMT